MSALVVYVYIISRIPAVTANLAVTDVMLWCSGIFELAVTAVILW